MATEQAEIKPQTLQDMQDHFRDLYGRRNEHWLPGRLPRIVFLTIGIGGLKKAFRHSWDEPVTETMLARVPSRIFALAQAVNNTSLTRAMIEKYPSKVVSTVIKIPVSAKIIDQTLS